MLFELLPDKEKEMIEKYIDNFALERSRKNACSLSHILRFWDDAKSMYLYRMLGDSFFAVKKICVAKDLEDIEDDLTNNCIGWNQPGEPFLNDFEDYIREHFTHDFFWSFNPDTADKSSNAYISYCLYKLIDRQVLARNIYEGPSCVVSGPDHNDKPFKLNKGCKASKALNSLCKLFKLNEEKYEKFRVAHSICLNEKNFSGNMVLSIHPLDYMTMSDNDNNWGSCMTWTDNGEYRLGTVEMMNSPMVVEAYLTSSTDYSPCTEVIWNNKKWRELFIVDPNAIVGIKGYPFWNRGLEYEAIKFIQDLAQRNLNWGPYTSEVYNIQTGETFNITDTAFGIENRPHYLTAETNYMYNDLYSNHQCVISVHAGNRIHLYYSGQPECMCCGNTYDFADADRLTCDDCCGTVRCADCGEPIYIDDAICIDGYYYCEYCADRNSCECNFCNTLHNEDNLQTVYIGVKDVGIITNICASACEDCLCDTRIKKKIVHGRWWSDTYYYIMVDDLNDGELNEIFGVWDEDQLQANIQNAKSWDRIVSFEDEPVKE